MRKPDSDSIKWRWTAALWAYLALPALPAQAHGLTPGLVGVFLGALAVHVLTPILLMVPNAFRGRRGRVFGVYAVTIGVYYLVMWTVGSGEMFVFPIFPVALAVFLYFVLGKVPEQD